MHKSENKSQTAATRMSQLSVGGWDSSGAEAGKDIQSPFIFAVNWFMAVSMSCPPPA